MHVGSTATMLVLVGSMIALEGGCFSGRASAPQPLAEEDTGFDSFPDAGISTSCRPELANDCPAGQKCTAYAIDEGTCCVGANKCVPIIGDRGLGQRCTRTQFNDDCADRLFCMTKSSGGVGEGSCVLMCDWTAEDSCPDLFGGPAQCIPLNGGVLPICERECNPFNEDCPVGYGCFPVGSYGFFCSASTPDAEGLDGDECYTISSCAPGLACISGAAQATCVYDRCCTPVCNTLDDPDPCVVEESCQPFYEPDEIPRRDLQHAGYCGIEL
ncbi:MAG: hypothetical protein ACPHRO_13060 [Nannocystaceae bacterium]